MPSATGDTSRIEALSDGVFAVAMTLLIIDIRVPDLSSDPGFGRLARDVLSLWPHFVTYAVSFLIVGLYWVSHHLLFDLIRRTDRGLMWINLFFLLFVVVIPFSTALLGSHNHNYFAGALLRLQHDLGRGFAADAVDVRDARAPAGR